MWGSTIRPYVAVLTLCSVASVSQAASLSIQPAEDLMGTVVQGNYFQVDIYMDFTDDPTIGGGFDILYDPSRVSYVNGSFLIAPTLDSDSAFTRDDDPAASALNQVEVNAAEGKVIGAAFGDFIGLTGPSLVGSMTFLAENVGLASFGLSATENLSIGNFISTFTLEPQDVSFAGTSISISPIPVPAAVWLMLSGLAGLAAVMRRKSA